MKEQVKLPEPTSADHLAMLVGPRKRAGGKMSATACQDPAKAKHVGKCCGGSRVWGEGNATEYVDGNRNSFAVYCCGACRLPLPLPPPATVETSPRTVTDVERATIEVKRQAALARKRAREESSPPPPPPPQMQMHAAADAPCCEALGNSSDWAENGELRIRLEYQGQYWF